ncbi:MAG: hypothetical protein KDA41_05090, partial [Planctomycetales bacterium]|nr:hypothetical protein [Planctomycetales bacterium]
IYSFRRNRKFHRETLVPSTRSDPDFNFGNRLHDRIQSKRRYAASLGKRPCAAEFRPDVGRF